MFPDIRPVDHLTAIRRMVEGVDGLIAASEARASIAVR